MSAFKSITKYFTFPKESFEDHISSTTTSPANSRPGSIFSFTECSASSSVSNKYLNDPMRSSNAPDYVGKFKDPMGHHYMQGPDCTNTGA
ncbi:hypothetical protein BDA99DRAFT_491730 [Phascolomyces articulosus]|uniref:Uncharacterized protein n=1 Tax=Phascolomyces articulosus TaxID=60185 RepID=A0AAD5KQT7_9FUNG|nr:hypothetical protein BDA99DRAFT_491724 [Phascolomyces articulosus]KAI9278288.1 hypothetical protein BDA99DRAFT_491730 [Phascolomyces articulosus]